MAFLTGGDGEISEMETLHLCSFLLRPFQGFF
jgi:hypothetical protein